MTEAKYKFLQSLEKPTDITKAVKYCVDKRLESGEDAYEVLATTNVNKNNKRVSAQTLYSLFTKVYELMYKYIAKLKPTTPISQQYQILRKKFEMGELKKSPTPEECREFFFETCPRILGDYAPLHAQSGNDVIGKDNNVYNDFIHIYPFEYPKKIDCRLYFNTTPENSCKIGELLLEECFKKHIRVYFKFDTAGDRNDSMLIYTNYERVNDFVVIINKIQKKHPELFDGAEKSGILTAKVNDFVSFGEEPEYKHSSFNAERAKAIDDFINTELNIARKYIGNYSGTFKTSTGENLNLKDYIVYRLKASYIETLKQTQENIKNGIFPEHINESNKKDYIEIENHIYTECIKKLPDSVINAINANADRIIADLKLGRKPIVPTIDYRTKRLGLSKHNITREQNLLKKYGFIRYSHPIDLDIEKKFFDMFDIQQQIKNNVTIENLTPFFKKYHCSTKYPHINTETEAELASIHSI